MATLMIILTVFAVLAVLVTVSFIAGIRKDEEISLGWNIFFAACFVAITAGIIWCVAQSWLLYIKPI